VTRTLALGLAALALSAGGPPDATGTYQRAGAWLGILDAGDGALVEYRATFQSAGGSADACECSFAARRGAGGFALDGPMERATLRVEGKRAVLEGGRADCCGLAWPGRDVLELSHAPPPAECVVGDQGARVYLRPPGRANRSQTVLILPPGTRLAALVGPGAGRYVPARWMDGPRRRIGYARRANLTCPARGA
jgi:hypothetical protein